MKRTILFTFRINSDERRMIEALAERLKRSRSDAIRWIVMSALQELDTTFRPNSHSNVLEEDRKNGSSFKNKNTE